MATNAHTIKTLLACLQGAGAARAKPMFGEYGIYLDDRYIGPVCDDQFYLKSTRAGLAFAPELALGPAYKGAKPGMVVPAERWDETEWLAKLLRLTVENLPPPKKRQGPQSP